MRNREEEKERNGKKRNNRIVGAFGSGVHDMTCEVWTIYSVNAFFVFEGTWVWPVEIVKYGYMQNRKVFIALIKPLDSLDA